MFPFLNSISAPIWTDKTSYMSRLGPKKGTILSWKIHVSHQYTDIFKVDMKLFKKIR